MFGGYPLERGFRGQSFPGQFRSRIQGQVEEIQYGSGGLLPVKRGVSDLLERDGVVVEGLAQWSHEAAGAAEDGKIRQAADNARLGAVTDLAVHGKEPQAATHLLDHAGDELRFAAFTAVFGYMDFHSLCLAGLEGYGPGIIANHLGRCFEDMIGAAVTVIQVVHDGSGKIRLIGLNKAHVRAAESVNRLVGVPDYHQVSPGTGNQGPDQFILEGIDILVLVHQHPLVSLPALSQDRIILFPGFQQQEKKIFQIQGIHSLKQR